MVPPPPPKAMITPLRKLSISRRKRKPPVAIHHRLVRLPVHPRQVLRTPTNQALGPTNKHSLRPMRMHNRRLSRQATGILRNSPITHRQHHRERRLVRRHRQHKGTCLIGLVDRRRAHQLAVLGETRDITGNGNIY